MVFCLPVPAALHRETRGRELVLVRYDGQQWAPMAGAVDDAAAGQVCAEGVTAFSPFTAGYRNAVSTFWDQTVGVLTFRVHEAREVRLPQATGGDGEVRYTLEPRTLPAGLSYTHPPDSADSGEVIRGTLAEETAVAPTR